MDATMLTLLLLAGGQLPSIDGQQQLAIAAQGDCYSCYSACDQCDCLGGCRCWTEVRGCLAACCGPMPQTCYAPRFGCYPGNNRHMNRYPAFHGYYYRQPYDYRHLFDYPWHATPHEPEGYFTYQGRRPATEGEEVLTPYPEPQSVLPDPLPLVPSIP